MVLFGDDLGGTAPEAAPAERDPRTLLAEFLAAVEHETYWALDWETLGDGVHRGSRLDPIRNVAEGAALCTGNALGSLGKPGGRWWAGFVRTLDRNEYVSRMAGAPTRPGTVGMPVGELLDALAPLMRDPTKVLVTHGASFDCRTGSKFPGWVWPRWHVDTQIGAWMGDENNEAGVRPQPYGLKELTEHYRGVRRQSYKQQDGLFGMGLDAYAGNDGDDTLWLWFNRVEPVLKAEGMMPAFLNVEMPCVQARSELEDAGVMIDRPFLEGARELYIQASAAAEERAYLAAGHRFNLGSTPQVSRLLYEELALPVPSGVKRGKSGDWPTGEDVLKRLPSHPVVEALLDRRGCEKFRSTFIDGVLEEARRYDGDLGDGRARFGVRQHGVDTGRWAASRIHQIPGTPDQIFLGLAEPLSEKQAKALGVWRDSLREGGVRVGKTLSTTGGVSFRFAGGPYHEVEIRRSGEEIGKSYEVEIRRAFIASPGCTFVDTDWSQLQLRVMAHYCQDPAMLEVYRRAVCDCEAFLATSTCEHLCGCEMYKAKARCGHVDLHQLTADKLGVPRKQAKAVNFGILFGMQAKGLATQLGIQKAAAQKILDGWWEAYPGAAEYRDKVWKQITQLGYVTTLTGRRRHVTRWHWDKMDEQEILRKIFCSVIQGGEADIMMVAYRDISREIRRLREEDPRWEKVKIVLQFHDEFMAECPTEMADEVANMVRVKMQNSIELQVPLVAEPAFGPSWAEAKAA